MTDENRNGTRAAQKTTKVKQKKQFKMTEY